MARPDIHPARRAWQVIEPIHAVTYFATSARVAATQNGLKGFWMGYFAQRCAPMGPASPEMATAVCFGFAPALVARALPDAWSRIEPVDALAVRRRAAAAVLRELVHDIDEVAERVNPLLSSVVRSASMAGRPLFAANRSLAATDDPAETLWQLTTTLREHRGDGHVSALVAHGVGAPHCHILATDDEGDRQLRRESRGWSDGEWETAVAELTERGLLDEREIAEPGRQLVASVESATDDAAWPAWESGLTAEGNDMVLRLLRPVAIAIWASGVIPRPNAMGLSPEAPPRND